MDSATTPSIGVRRTGRTLATTIRLYWPLIKSLQTLLLLITGLGGYMSGHRPEVAAIAAVAGSLFLAISGCTVLNMVLDRDIDARMERTAGRPLPSGRIHWRSALLLGAGLSGLGLGWALALDPLYGAIVAAGLFFDVVIYTLWLKRRTPWSILWGGISGGMPVLAGRALSVGRIDLIGILLALGVLAWIPSHILPLTVKYLSDYQRAGLPCFPGTFGLRTTRVMIGVAVTITLAVMLAAAALSGIPVGFLIALGCLGLGLLIVALLNMIIPVPRLNTALFKLASLYLLGTMALIVAG